MGTLRRNLYRARHPCRISILSAYQARSFSVGYRLSVAGAGCQPTRLGLSPTLILPHLNPPRSGVPTCRLGVFAPVKWGDTNGLAHLAGLQPLVRSGMLLFGTV